MKWVNVWNCCHDGRFLHSMSWVNNHLMTRLSFGRSAPRALLEIALHEKRLFIVSLYYSFHSHLCIPEQVLFLYTMYIFHVIFSYLWLSKVLGNGRRCYIRDITESLFSQRPGCVDLHGFYMMPNSFTFHIFGACHTCTITLIRSRTQNRFTQHKITLGNITSGLHCKTILACWTNMDLT